MRHLLLLAASLAALALPAQSPLGLPLTSNNGLGIGSQIFFDVNVTHGNGITITALDVNTGTSPIGTMGSVEVYAGPASHVGNEQQVAGWMLVASGVVVAAGNDQPSRVCLGSGFFLPAGSAGLAVRHVGVSMRYTDGTGVNQTATTAEVSLSAGASQGTPFSSSAIAPRVFNGNVHYHTGSASGGPCASKAVYGTGCYEGTTTFFEQFASLQAFDFAGGVAATRVLTASPVGAAGYSVQAGTSAWRTPVGPKVLANGVLGAMGDDSMSQPLVLPFAFAFPGGSTTVVHASANGYVVLSPTLASTSDFTPTPGELVSQQPRLCPLWMDLHPGINLSSNAQSGVYYNVEPSNQTVYITWLDCADRRGGVPPASATSVNVQCALHVSGAFEFCYGVMLPFATGSGALLTGSSRGNVGSGNVGSGNAGNPGSVDLSAVLPFVTAGPDSRALALDSNVPRLGATWTFTTRHVPNLAPLGILLVGSYQVPGVDLGVFGAPGCRAYTDANLTTASFAVAPSTGTGTLYLPIPNVASLIGVTWTTQSAALSLANALRLVTSNGLTGTIGN
ncbi:MAG: hypothetical protein ABIP94_09570 [Planctomycetota bacterium]